MPEKMLRNSSWKNLVPSHFPSTVTAPFVTMATKVVPAATDCVSLEIQAASAQASAPAASSATHDANPRPSPLQPGGSLCHEAGRELRRDQWWPVTLGLALLAIVFAASRCGVDTPAFTLWSGSPAGAVPGDGATFWPALLALLVLLGACERVAMECCLPDAPPASGASVPVATPGDRCVARVLVCVYVCV